MDRLAHLLSRMVSVWRSPAAKAAWAILVLTSAALGLAAPGDIDFP